MLKVLAPGDVVTVTRIDRLARSTFDLFAIVKQIVDAKAQFRSLAEPWADTGTSTGRLMIALLGGLRTWSVISSAPVPPRAAAGHRSAGSIWADRRN
jgi:DNA invertase Pin-like site-specific DNA recombinase